MKIQNGERADTKTDAHCTEDSLQECGNISHKEIETTGVEDGVPHVIPEKVYNNLPEMLKPLLDTYKVNDPKRDVILIALITHLSGASHFISGNYHDRDYYPNLISFQLGAAASGKGEAIWAKEIIESIEVVFQEADNPLKKFIIAGNSTRAMLYARLTANNGVGVISETEAMSSRIIIKVIGKPIIHSAMCISE
ncbi:MAG: hypothetical protein IPN29_15910 [Saprospiraceae bacterium]|nr:hypothetical protein [Saprospiraceae bacterium]